MPLFNVTDIRVVTMCDRLVRGDWLWPIIIIITFTDVDSPGSPLDFSIIRDSKQLRLAVLSKVQDKCLVTLLMIPDRILCGGNICSI